jgi:hypothetical protein
MEPPGSAQRSSRAKKQQVDISWPYLISQYNKIMGGVDQMDQNTGYPFGHANGGVAQMEVASFLLVGCHNVELVDRILSEKPASGQLHNDSVSHRAHSLVPFSSCCAWQP